MSEPLRETMLDLVAWGELIGLVCFGIFILVFLVMYVRHKIWCRRLEKSAKRTAQVNGKLDPYEFMR